MGAERFRPRTLKSALTRIQRDIDYVNQCSSQLTGVEFSTSVWNAVYVCYNSGPWLTLQTALEFLKDVPES